MRPKGFRRARPGETKVCHTCYWMGRTTGLCWRYIFPVKRRDTCVRWRAA